MTGLGAGPGAQKMSQLSDVQSFIDKSRKVARPEDLQVLVQDISWEMGFDHYALLHHVDLRPYGPKDGRVVTSEFIALSNYPQYWVDQYVSEEVVNFDPVLLASQRTNVGFGWHQLPELVHLTDMHRQIIESTRKAGLTDGFTVPANVPGELNGSCNFAVACGRTAPRTNYPMAQLAGSFAFQAARTLVERNRGVGTTLPVQLTQRQLECIVLVARGKTDWEIGKILGITEETVKRHIADSRARYDVPKRTQVVLRALYDGLVPLSELLT
jgi:LuxR family transcriptional regulator, quorum-sensing system regulator CciR